MVSFDIVGPHFDNEEIADLLRCDSKLLHCWAHECGLDIMDERLVHGWPEHFWYFYKGWYCANNVEEILTAYNRASLPCGQA
jgi:hypothetical protein